MSTPKRRFNLLSLTFIVLCFKKSLLIRMIIQELKQLCKVHRDQFHFLSFHFISWYVMNNLCQLASDKVYLLYLFI